jgi:hypothetical protein
VEILSAGILIDEESVARACCQVYCQIDFSLRDLPLAALIPRVKSGILVTEGVEVICRLQALPASQRLTDMLVSIGDRSPLTVVCLCRIAETAKGVELLIKNPQWMTPGCLSFSNAFIVFLRICAADEYRSAVTELDTLPAFLSWLSEEGTDKELDSVVSVIRRMKDIPLAKLDTTQFFERFITRSLDSANVGLRDRCILLIDRLGRFGWATGFVHFIRRLKGLLQGHGPTARKAFSAAYVVSLHSESKPHLIEASIVEEIKTVSLDAASEKYRQSLVDFLLSL